MQKLKEFDAVSCWLPVIQLGWKALKEFEVAMYLCYSTENNDFVPHTALRARRLRCTTGRTFPWPHRNTIPPSTSLAQLWPKFNFGRGNSWALNRINKHIRLKLWEDHGGFPHLTQPANSAEANLGLLAIGLVILNVAIRLNRPVELIEPADERLHRRLASGYTFKDHIPTWNLL